MEKILISENTHEAEKEIAMYKRIKLSLEKLISYNNVHADVVPKLDNINTLKLFIKNPVNYYTDLLFDKLGMGSLTDSAKKKIGRTIYTIGKQNNISWIRLYHHAVEIKSYDENAFTVDKRLRVMLKPTFIKLIKDSHKQYIESKEDLERYKRIKMFCNLLDKYCAQENIPVIDRYSIDTPLHVVYDGNNFEPNLKIWQSTHRKNTQNC